MADADIVARMRLNAQEFSSEFGKVLDFSEARSKRAGGQISAALGGQVGESVRSLAAQIPVVGNSISGLSGPLLIGAAGFGALALGIGSAFKASEEYEASVRQLDAVLTATGNTTGLTTDALKAYAEELEGAFAIDAEQFLKAEQVLSSFGGVAGDTFKRATKDAAELSAVYGGDLPSNAEKLGTVLQNLAEGEVKGLSKGFKFLGEAQIDVITRLAQTGQGAAAQGALLDALERKLNGAGEAAASGLTGAFFRFKDAIGDATREIATQSGLLPTLAAGFDSVARSIANATGAASTTDQIVAKIQKIAAVQADLAKLESGGFRGSVPAFADKAQLRRLEADLATLQAKGRGESNAAIDAIDSGKAAADKAAKDGQAKRDRAAADDAAKRSAAERASAAKAEAAAQEQARKAYAKFLEDLERGVDIAGRTKGQQELITAELKAQELAQKAGLPFDKQRVDNAVLLKLALEGAAAAGEKLSTLKPGELLTGLKFSDFATGNGALDPAGDQAKAVRGVNADQLDDVNRNRVQDYTDAFYTALDGGVDAVAQRFQSQMTGAIAKFAGTFVASLSDKAAGTIANGADLGSGLKQAAIEFAISSALAPLQPLLNAVSKGIGKIVEYSPIGLLQKLIFKIPKGTVDISTGSQGQIDVGDFSGTKKLAREVTALGSAFASSLKQIADALNGSLEANVDLGTIGKKGKKFTFDPDGKSGPIKAQKFKTEQGALEAAQRYAITSGALALSAGARKLASGSGDFATQLAKAAQFENVFTELAQATDPVGAAVDKLNKQFRDIVAVFDEAGASAEDIAKASQLYDIKLKAINDTAKQTTATLDDFLKSLKLGSDSPLSLRDQEATARAAYDAVAGKIGTTDFDQAAFADAGKALLDVEKQINGTTADFFVAYDRVRADTERSIAAITAASSTAAGDNPFAKRTADATAATADNTSAMLQALLDLPGKLSGAAGTNGGGQNFIGAPRAF